MASTPQGLIMPELIKAEVREFGFCEHYGNGAVCIRHWTGLVRWIGDEPVDTQVDELASLDDGNGVRRAGLEIHSNHISR
jgi:hypothetical protein